MTATRDLLIRQFDTACRLTDHHLDGLTTAECLWRPATAGLHVRRGDDGLWRADWPEREDYTIGPPSIAWTSWHVIFWWSTAIDRNFGPGTLERAAVLWPGDADGVRAGLAGLEARWRSELSRLGDADLLAPDGAHWPFQGRPLADVAAWASLELAKNAAEIGYARFLYAVRGEPG
ncbi:MAG: DinB family protein [Pseudomonadota bacterium]